MSGEKNADTIGSRILRGVAWKAGSQVSLQIMRMITALVLARLLVPHEWGVAAMVLVFSGVVAVFTDNALGTALVQRRHLQPGDRSTVFWISTAIGVLLMLCGFLLAGPLASFYGEPDVRPLFAVLSIAFLVSALGTTHAAVLIREMDFRTLELRVMVATLAGAVTAIVIALRGFGAWAIVSQQLAEVTVSTAILWWFTPWRPSFRFSLASLRRLGAFAGNVFGENLLYQAGRNAGNLIVGRALGATALGTYALATTVVLVPFSRIAAPLQQVFFPAFSRLQDDVERVAAMWIRVTRLIAAVAMPTLIGLVIVAPELVQVVLGSRWEEATPLIQILACAGLFQALQTLATEILLARNRSGTLLRFTGLWTAVTIGAVVMGLRWGIVGVAASYAVATALLELLRGYLAARALEISVWKQIFALAGVTQATALMAAVVLLAREALAPQDLPPAVSLAVFVVLGALVYVPCCAWRAPEVVDEVRSLRRRRHGAAVVPTGLHEPV